MVGRPVQTRFRCAYAYRLKLARHTNSLAHYTKGTPSPHEEAPTACRHPVSGHFHSPRRGAFHLSLTALVRYRYPWHPSPWWVVPPCRSDERLLGEEWVIPV